MMNPESRVRDASVRAVREIPPSSTGHYSFPAASTSGNCASRRSTVLARLSLFVADRAGPPLPRRVGPAPPPPQSSARDPWRGRDAEGVFSRPVGAPSTRTRSRCRAGTGSRPRTPRSAPPRAPRRRCGGGRRTTPPPAGARGARASSGATPRPGRSSPSRPTTLARGRGRRGARCATPRRRRTSAGSRAPTRTRASTPRTRPSYAAAATTARSRACPRRSARTRRAST